MASGKRSQAVDRTGSRGPKLNWCALEMRSVTSLARDHDHVPERTGEQRGGVG